MIDNLTKRAIESSGGIFLFITSIAELEEIISLM
jgi:hypothetical protein